MSCFVGAYNFPLCACWCCWCWFFFCSCLWLHNTTILYYFIIPWYEVLSSIPFKLWNYAKQRLSESHDSPFKFEYELQLSWTTAVVFSSFFLSRYTPTEAQFRKREREKEKSVKIPENNYEPTKKRKAHKLCIIR